MKLIKYQCFIVVVLLFYCSFSVAQESDTDNRSQLLVKVKNDFTTDIAYDARKTSQELLIKMPFLKKMNVNCIRKAYPSDNPVFNKIYRVFFDSSVSSEVLTEEFLKYDFIEYARSVPNAKLFYNFPDDYNENIQYNLHIIDAPAAWNLVTSPQEVVIAIVDDAVNINHEDLRNNIWVNQGEMNGIGSSLYQAVDVDHNNEITSEEIYNYLVVTGIDYNGDGVINLTDVLVSASPFTNNVDDEGNSYIDDIFGWDAANNDNNPNPDIFSDYAFTHGTHVAGIAGAISNNNLGIASIGYNVKILPVKCALIANGQLPYGDDGLVYVADVNDHCEKVHVINMSWGGSTDPLFYVPYLDVLHGQGTVLVAASGNDGATTNSYPAYNRYVIAVGATDMTDNVCSFSNRNDSIDVMAPGQDIYSTLSGTTSSYGNLTGTSMSSPLVAGLCGLMLSVDNTMTPGQIESCLKAGCDNDFSWYTNSTSMYYGLSGAGRVNALKSLVCVTGATGPISSFTFSLNQTSCYNIQFSDLSINANYWKWDFENDGSIDAIIQNPSFTYPGYGTYFVKLEVSSDGLTWNSFVRSISILAPGMEINVHSDEDACKNHPSYLYLAFTGTEPWTFEWFVNDISQGEITTSNNPYELPYVHDDIGIKNVRVTLIHDKMCSNIVSDSVIFIVSNCYCTKEFNNWVYGTYSGTYSGLNFNNGVPTQFVTSITPGVEGTSVISDINGDLLFYSDGQKIWNKNHNVMQNGNLGLNTGSVTNSSLIVRKPGSSSLYYVFTLTINTNHLYYSVVDISLNGGLGSVISGPTVVYNTDLLDEKMGLAKHSNGQDVWLLAHGSSFAVSPGLSYSFLAFKISATGIDSPIITQTIDYDNIHGGMKFSRDGSMFAWNLQTYATIYKFDKGSGVVSNPIRIFGFNSQDYSGFGAYAYGLDFSPDNSKLYISGFITAAKTIQYDLSSNNEVTINATKKVLFGAGSGAMQIGPDLRIYTGTGYIIPNPNAPYPECGYFYSGVITGFLSLPAPVLHAECVLLNQNDTELFNKEQIRVYPVPNFGILNVEINDFDGAGTIEIYNAIGVLIQRTKLSGYYSQIDISTLLHGLYLAKIYTSKGMVTKKIVKK